MADFTYYSSDDGYYSYNSGANSHVIGYGRYEYINVKIPQYVPGTTNPIISAKITGGSLSITEQECQRIPGSSGTLGTIYFEIEPLGVNQNLYLGEVVLNGNWLPLTLDVKNPTNANVVPGTTYQICFYTETNGQRYFPNTTDGFSITLNIEYESYTACKPVTKIEFDKEIQKRNGSFNISWDGAEGGISNPIKNYQIEYKIGSASWQVLSKTISPSIKKYSFTIPSTATQGEKIKARIKVIGTVSGYDSTTIESTTSVTINTIPKQPTISLSGTVLSNNTSSGQVKEIKVITAKNNGDVDTSQSNKLKLLYTRNKEITVNNDGTTDGIDLSTNTTFTNTGTYRFYVFDGLEVSNPVIYTISSNSIPTVSINFTINSSATNYQSNSTSTTYTYGFTLGFSFSGGQSSGNTFDCKIHYGTNKNNLVNSYTLQSYAANTNIKVDDIRKIVAPGNYYRIAVTRKDAYDSCVYVYPSGSEPLYIPVPKLFQIVNEFNENLLSTSSNYYFSQKIYPVFYKDGGYNKVDLEIEKNNKYESIISGITLGNGTQAYLSQGTMEKIDEKGTNILYGSNTKLYFKLYNSSTGAFYRLNANLKRIEYETNYNSKANLNGMNDIINPFMPDADGEPNVNDNIKITIRNFFQTSSITSILTQYGFTSSPTFTMRATYNSINKNIDIEPTNISYGASEITFTITKKQIFELYKDFGMSRHSTTLYPVKFGFLTTNRFGNIYDSSEDFQVRWSTPPKITLTDFQIGKSTNPSFLKEGMSIIGNLSVTSYHGDFKYITITGKKGSIEFYSKTITPIIINNNGTTTQLPNTGTYTINDSIGPQSVDIINTSDDDVIFTISGTDKLGQVVKIDSNAFNNKKMYIYAHVPGEVFISSANYAKNTSDNSDNYNLNIKFNITKYGINDDISNYSRIQSIKLITTSLGTISIQDGEMSLKDAWDTDITLPKEIGAFEKIQLEIVLNSYYKDNINGKSTKTFYSNEFAVYNSTPTVSYRQNQVGINFDLSKLSTLTVEQKDNLGLVIGAHSGKQFVLLKGSDTTGLIDLESGSIYGFHIDCGDDAW